MVFQICQGNKADSVLDLTPICKEPHTKVQLTVPLREITLKAYFFSSRARSWTRVHVWQLHVDILPAAYSELHRTGGRKGKSVGGHLTTSALRLRTRTATAVKTAVCTVNVSVACNVLRSLSAFAFCNLHSLPLVLDRSWSLCAYLSQVQYGLQNFTFVIERIVGITVKIKIESCFGLFLYFHSSRCCKWTAVEVPYLQTDRT